MPVDFPENLRNSAMDSNIDILAVQELKVQKFEITLQSFHLAVLLNIVP